MKRNREYLLDESGAVQIVEAAFVYPIVIFVVIVFIFLGNVFYQQARVESVAARGAEALAAYYSNSLLMNEVLPTNTNSVRLDPYRYLFSGKDAEARVEKKIRKELEEIGTGLFSGMNIRPNLRIRKIENHIVSQTARVEISYTMNFYPMKLFDELTLLRSSVAVETSVADPAEFIRNVDMLMDYSESYGISDKIKETVGKFTGK